MVRWYWLPDAWDVSWKGGSVKNDPICWTILFKKSIERLRVIEMFNRDNYRLAAIWASDSESNSDSISDSDSHTESDTDSDFI